jgi:hypothetical protein
MKILIATAAAAAVTLTVAATPVQAREGCGPGYHRASNGMCRANRGTAQRWVEGHYYQGHGYWANGRWWHKRYRYHNNWRYR